VYKEFLLLFFGRNLDNFSNREQGERSRRHTVCGMFQFAVPTMQSVFGRMVRGQQPFGGVGRLCLSVSGSLEPRSDKCNDLRPFLYSQKSAK